MICRSSIPALNLEVGVELRPALDRTAARLVGGRNSALRMPGHDDGMPGVRWLWGGTRGALGWSGRRETAWSCGVASVSRHGRRCGRGSRRRGRPGRHRRPEMAKRPCSAWIRRSYSAASSQGSTDEVLSPRPTTVETDETDEVLNRRRFQLSVLNLTEQCRLGV